MRYAVIENCLVDGRRKVTNVYHDLSLQSARDIERAWGYQAKQRRGWMEVVSESQVDVRVAEIEGGE